MTEEIEVLEWLEAVRRRPAMYVGDVRDPMELWKLCVLELLEKHRAGEVRSLRASVDEDGWIELVSDERSCMPFESHGRSGIELAVATLYCGTGPAPFARAAACALSSRLELTTSDGERRWRTWFERGSVRGPVTCEPWSAARATVVRFLPDPSIFASSILDRAQAGAMLEELARLHPLLRIEWNGRELPHRDGIGSWVEELCGRRSPFLAAVPHVRSARDGVELELSLGWRDGGAPELRSFANDRPTLRGTHHAGLFAALEAIAATEAPDLAPSVARELLSDGLVAVIVLRGSVSFAGATRDVVASKDIVALVRDAVVGGDRIGWAVRARLRERMKHV